MARGFSAQTRSLISNAIQSETSAELSGFVLGGDAPLIDAAGDSSCITVGLAAGSLLHPPARSSSNSRVSRPQSEVSEPRSHRLSELQLSLLERQSRRLSEQQRSLSEHQIRRLSISYRPPLSPAAASPPRAVDSRMAAASFFDGDETGGHGGGFWSRDGGWGNDCRGGGVKQLTIHVTIPPGSRSILKPSLNAPQTSSPLPPLARTK